MKPQMVIADEPVSALDVSVQAQVINLLNKLKEEMGLTILFIAHNLSVVKYFSDRIGVMYYGKLVEMADSDELFKNPMHPYTRACFLPSRSRIPSMKKNGRRSIMIRKCTGMGMGTSLLTMRSLPGIRCTVQMRNLRR